MIDVDYRVAISTYLSPSEMYGLAENILNASDGVIPTDPATLERKQFVTLTDLNQVLATALGRGRTEDAQKQAKDDSDRKRDTGFVRIKETVNSIAGDEDEEDQALKDAAALIKQVLADYPSNLHNTKLQENTALLDSLIPKLRAEPAATAIATLGLTRYVDRMHDGNEAFKQAVEASAADRSDEPPANRAAANPVRWHVSQFASNLMYLGATEDAYAPLAAQIRQFIDDAEAIARARRTRRQGEGDTQEPPNETT